MRSLSMLQLGDIHYPDEREALGVDRKDEAIATSLVQRVAPRPLQAAIRKAARLKEKVDVLLLCGDLTSWGDYREYQACVDYLADAFALKASDTDKLHVVPGNHDIDRSVSSPEERFRLLATTWESHDLPVLCQDIRHTHIAKGKRQLDVFSLNSCFGCGEERHLPRQIQDEILAAIEQHKASSTVEEHLQLVTEVLDTPACTNDSVERLCDAARVMSDTSVPIIVTHHNLLPQTTPRFSIYAEMVNAGVIRSRLTSLSKTVLYFHGHIHDDPIEVISTPNNYNFPLVSISAPKITQGFNLIEIHYSVSSAFPLGCTVTPYRVDRSGQFTKQRPYRIPLLWPPLQYEGYVTPRMRVILDKLGSEYIYFEDLRTSLRDAGKNYKRQTITSALLEAEWLGLVDIANRDKDSQGWHLRSRK